MFESTDKKKCGYYLWFGRLPKSLSAQENLELLAEYKKTGDKELYDKILNGNLRLVANCVKKIYKKYIFSHTTSYPDYEDLLQIGTLTLMKAINSSNCEKNWKFSTYLFSAIKYTYENVYYMGRGMNNLQSLNEMIEGLHDNEYELINTIPDDKEDLEIDEKVDIHFVQENILPLLSKKEREIYWLYHIKEKTLNEIGEMYGQTRENIRVMLSDIDERIREMYFNGITDADRAMRGVRLTASQVKRLRANQELFKTYGRGFLKNYFVPTLTSRQKEVFNAYILNYLGQSSGDVDREINSKRSLTILKDVERKLKINIPKLMELKRKGKLGEEKPISIDVQQKIERNEKFLESYGGKMFLYRYFMPILNPNEREFFRVVFLSYDGEPVSEMMQELDIDKQEFLTTHKSLLKKLKTANFDLLIDLLDNNYSELQKFKKNNLGGFDLEEIAKRRKVVDKYGRDILIDHFLPMLDNDEAIVFNNLYVNLKNPTILSLAKELNVPEAFVLELEKRVIEKLENTNLEELEKLSFMAETYLEEIDRRKFQAKMKDSFYQQRQERLQAFGGEAFLREKFLPMLKNPIDRKIFEEHFINCKSFSEVAKILSSNSGRSFVEGRMRQNIKPVLKEFVNSFQDYTSAVKAFYDESGLKMEQVKYTSNLQAEQPKLPFTKQLISACGGERNIIRKFMPTLKTLFSQFVFYKAFVEKKDDKTIATEIEDTTVEDVANERKNIKKSLIKFATNRFSKSNKDK